MERPGSSDNEVYTVMRTVVIEEKAFKGIFLALYRQALS